MHCTPAMMPHWFYISNYRKRSRHVLPPPHVLKHNTANLKFQAESFGNISKTFLNVHQYFSQAVLVPFTELKVSKSSLIGSWACTKECQQMAEFKKEPQIGWDDNLFPFQSKIATSQVLQHHMYCNMEPFALYILYIGLNSTITFYTKQEWTVLLAMGQLLCRD